MGQQQAIEIDRAGQGRWSWLPPPKESQLEREKQQQFAASEIVARGARVHSALHDRPMQLTLSHGLAIAGELNSLGRAFTVALHKNLQTDLVETFQSTPSTWGAKPKLSC
jgi:hypothetical protein